ncbi:MAG TPA: CrcB family protein [Sphingomicrobium sp.]|jgi:fluoride exporter|nr:CrcB family protein [Sphingomicrobium sp.]
MTSAATPYLLVFLGGGVGSALRLAMFHLCRLWLPPSFPFGTLVVNVAGSFAVGAVAGWLLTRSAGGTDPIALFLVTGLLGGFTTFSAFSLDALMLWQRGDQAACIAYVIASVLLSLGAAIAGIGAVRLLD